MKHFWLELIFLFSLDQNLLGFVKRSLSKHLWFESVFFFFFFGLSNNFLSIFKWRLCKHFRPKLFFLFLILYQIFISVYKRSFLKILLFKLLWTFFLFYLPFNLVLDLNFLKHWSLSNFKIVRCVWIKFLWIFIDFYFNWRYSSSNI
jgi:hypothetical protein